MEQGGELLTGLQGRGGIWEEGSEELNVQRVARKDGNEWMYLPGCTVPAASMNLVKEEKQNSWVIMILHPEKYLFFFFFLLVKNVR